ncbi:hypothetical protein SG34_000190 [Thalassomonas viridans]|uniref:Uncharacterized protein n=1 Tax=Thalassomonas viridans TaxID=137584 RepID=A0AAE9Z340_9GAMM|nr:hypothetical protein [Thalassomonas viridans]WDE05407.1 hypothetical protein SG34_000190 [Thalassomonas viridans]
MNLYKSVFAASLLLTSTSLLAAGVVYVSGSKYTMNKADFLQSGNNYTAYLQVDGDTGQQLIFDVDARVAGLGKESPEKDCNTSCHYKGPVDFRYVVEMQVSCSGIAIGSEMDNRNELNDTWVDDRSREVKLLVDNTLTTGGNCQQLQVDVKGVDVDTIETIELDVLVGEVF